MSDEVVFALFEPSEAKLLTSTSQTKLLVDNPILASALSNIFPYLLFFDYFLEVITWTNGDPYQNCLLVVCYSVLVLYWQTLKYWIVPMLMSLVFSSVVWTTNSVMQDAKYGERPTLDEVLLTLHNITVRFELFLRPAKHLQLTRQNSYKMLIGALLATPLQLVLTNTILSPRRYLWVMGLFFLTFHSPWSFAIRRLIWRSVYVRRVAYYLTGLDIRTARNDDLLCKRAGHSTISRTHSAATTDIEELTESRVPASDKVKMINNFTILRKVIMSPTQLRQTVRFDILENERRWIGLGWSKLLLPSERASFCYESLMMSAPDPWLETEFRFPVFENDLYTYLWQWMDDKWSIDQEFNRSRYKSGWVYYDTNWKRPAYQDGFSRYTRTRKWTRRAILLIDKQAEVLDG
ncbi:CIC11C00000005505 [Sungouiella intermedia]|uniref:CIC11C00000005505 n=1 Tax=Sungouiella intermedia TaxID=45354 RepID=A0A1L0DP08_9ASCO|nr:CIC11C00000005505 [[Candida] intermedia]